MRSVNKRRATDLERIHMGDGRSLPHRGHVRLGEDRVCRCGKSFYSPRARPRKFCSLACRDEEKRAERVNEENGTARCARCKEWKPVDDFVKGAGGRPHSHCKPCNSEWFRSKRGGATRAYFPRAKNDEERAQRKKENQARANAKRITVKLLHNRLRKQKERAGGKMPTRHEIASLMESQRGECNYCGAGLDSYHIDHRHPVSKGGTNDLKNLQLLCPKCNLSKGAMTHEEYIMSKRNRGRVIQHLKSQGKM